MNPVLKKAYKAEYENSNITIPDLIAKYSLDEEDLGSTKNWQKHESLEPVKSLLVKPDPEEFHQVIKPDKKPIVVDDKSSGGELLDGDSNDDPDDMLKDI